MTASPRKPLRLLLVDDNDEIRRVLARLLTSRGFEVRTVGDAEGAMAAMDQPPPPEVVLTDLQLPDLDGLHVARRARDLVPRPLIVLVTGWSFEADLRELSSSGIDQVFYKPLEIDDLVARLLAALPRPS